MDALKELVKKVGGIVAALINAVMQPLAQPLRQFHLTIGHSTVSAAALICIAILGSVIYLDFRLGPSWRSLAVVEERLRTENARSVELANKERELVLEEKAAGATPPRLGSFTELGVTTNANQLMLTVFPLKGATKIRVEWGWHKQIDIGGQSSQVRQTGIKSFDVLVGPDGPAPEVQTFIMGNADFGEAWTSGVRIDLTIKQVADDGRASQYSRQVEIAVP